MKRLSRPGGGRPAPPAGWRRVLARLPLIAYRIGLGFLFGRRLLLLRHTGRVSGRIREVCLEVVEHDEAQGRWTVASGFGTRSQWYRNLRHTPEASVQVGRSRRSVRARFLPATEGADVMERYARRHPRAARALCRYLALPWDGTAQGYRRAGAELPFVCLEEEPVEAPVGPPPAVP
ncbi:nitroreductase family deazaflavin-dependent oxidoreductase [Streptomyces sp. NPDC006879]|uniref:nitroreductase family deazaflavin-dependent oxidoreductase n=1 Tax=Streptomyces sp. NPDC006879 TaxID=3364767 RepID=UPI0036B15292